MNTNLPIELHRLMPGRTLPRRTHSAAEASPRAPFRIRVLLARMLALAGGLSLLLFASACIQGLLSEGAAGLLRGALLPSLPGAAAVYISQPAEETPPSPVEEESTSPAAGEPEAVDVYAFDAGSVPDGNLPIIPVDLSTVFATAEPYLSNATKYQPDLAALFAAEYPLAPAASLAAAGEPLVLILHTHGTEAYSEEGSISYSDTYNLPRSNDVTQNVVAVGSVMTEQLLVRGIPTLHCTVMHDEESYRDSYSRAAETIRAYLSEYPSIRYVFDVHRDSIVRESGEKLCPVFERDGEAIAQVMSVIGTDELGADFPDWEKNLNLALKLHVALETKYGAMSRPINLRGAAFNEHFSDASLLLEVGSCGNTLAQAKRAGVLLADTLADLILAGNSEE